MSTTASSYPETRTWSASSALPKLHSRARETETLACAGVTITKSLERIEIQQCIYESCDGLGLFSQDPIGFGGGDANLYRMVGNHPTMATDPSGLQEPWRPPFVIPPSSPGMGYAIQAQQGQAAVSVEFSSGDPAKHGGVIEYSGDEVMRQLSIPKYVYGWGFRLKANDGKYLEPNDYRKFKEGCQGLNKLRLNSDSFVFQLPGTRAFSTLEAAMEAQLEMINTSNRKTRIVISAYQDNYLDDQLLPFLLSGSATEFNLSELKQIRGPMAGVDKKGNLAVFDFITVHQNNDRSVCFYETMDFGFSANQKLIVKHKANLYPPERAGTVFFVTPIVDHPRTPRSPLGNK